MGCVALTDVRRFVVLLVGCSIAGWPRVPALAAAVADSIDPEDSFRRARVLVQKTYAVRVDATLACRPPERALRQEAEREGVWDRLPFLLYDSANDTVYFDRERFRVVRTGARTIAQLDAVVTLLFAHELIHSSQKRCMAGRPPHLGGRQLRFLCEGHAWWFTRKLGEKLGLPRHVAIFDAPRMPTSFSTRRNKARSDLLRYLVYGAAPRYISVNGPRFDDFTRLVARRALSYPEMLGKAPPKGLPSKQLGRRLEALGTLGWKVTARALDYLDAMAHFEPEGFTDDRYLYAFVEARAAGLVDPSGLRIGLSVVRLRDPRSAALLFRSGRDGRPTPPRAVSSGLTEWLRERTASIVVHRGTTSDGATTRCLFAMGSHVVEIDVPADRQAERAATRLLGKLLPK